MVWYGAISFNKLTLDFWNSGDGLACLPSQAGQRQGCVGRILGGALARSQRPRVRRLLSAVRPASARARPQAPRHRRRLLPPPGRRPAPPAPEPARATPGRLLVRRTRVRVAGQWLILFLRLQAKPIFFHLWSSLFTACRLRLRLGNKQEQKNTAGWSIN